MNIKKNNVFIYPIEKVVFPYHEYAFSITSNLYDRTYFLIQPSNTITSSASSPKWMMSRIPLPTQSKK